MRMESEIAFLLASSCMIGMGILGLWLRKRPPNASAHAIAARMLWRRAMRKIRGTNIIVRKYDSDDEDVPVVRQNQNIPNWFVTTR